MAGVVVAIPPSLPVFRLQPQESGLLSGCGLESGISLAECLNEMTIRLLIADDHEVVRSGLVALLIGSGIEVVGEAASGEEALERTRELHPHVVLMDIRMLEVDGLSALERLPQRRRRRRSSCCQPTITRPISPARWR